MKKILIMMAVIGLGVAAASAGGGGVGVYGSFVDTDHEGSGLGAGLKFKFDIAEYVAAELRASYLTGYEEDGVDLDNLYMIPLEADLLFNLPLGDSPVTFYAGAGFGYYILPEFEVEAFGITTDIDLEDAFGFYGIGGLEFLLGDSVVLFAEAKYLMLEVDTETIDGVDVGGEEGPDFSGFGANAGIMFKF